MLITVEELLAFLASNSSAVVALVNAIKGGISSAEAEAAIVALGTKAAVAAADAEMASEFPNG